MLINSILLFFFIDIKIKGYITTTNPSHACEKISPPPNIPTSDYQWIALIPRTKDAASCPFIVKVNF
jgi:hypothetical protein